MKPTNDVAELRIIDGSEVARHVKVIGAVRIGRADEADVQLDGADVSRLHARIVRTEAGAYELEDLASRNGTFVNGQRVQRARLTFGDRIKIGASVSMDFERFDAAADHLRRRQRFETIGRLGLGIAHDLNNVLAALVAGTSYLKQLSGDHTLGHSDVQDCIGDLVLAAGRASDLTRSMLSFVRGARTERSVVDLSKLIGEVARLLGRLLDERIRVETSVEQDMVVCGNWSELHQVVLNLCLNARDAMPDGGALRLAANAIEPRAAIPNWKGDDPVVALSVSDTGIGMDEETRANAFQPLFTTKQHESSYGLGLSTVHEIVVRHGGRITVESAKGKGSRFTVYLPRVCGSALRLSSTKESTPGAGMRLRGRNLRILLVDDDAMVRKGIARLLRRAGVEVIEAANGSEGLAQYQPGAFDLVVLDLDMPGLNGAATHAELTRLDPDARIALATGHVDAQAASSTSWRTHAVVAILQKPYSLDTIIDLARSGSRPQLASESRQERVSEVLPTAEPVDLLARVDRKPGS